MYHDGVGSILMLKPVSPFWVDVSEGWAFVLLIMLLLLFFAVLIVVGVRQQRAAAVAKTGDTVAK